MRKVLLALVAIALLATPALSGVQILSDINATLAASAGDQHRFDARQMRTATIIGTATAGAAASMKVGIYYSVDGTTWFPMANPSGTAPADSALTFTIASVGTIKATVPLWTEYKTGAAWSRLPELAYPRVKVVVTNNGTVSLSSIKFWVAYQ
jgi:hypothetical protein